MIIDDCVWTYQDYGDFLVLYNNARYSHFIVKDIYTLFFRETFINRKQPSEVIEQVASTFGVLENQVANDYKAFRHNLEELSLTSSKHNVSKKNGENLTDRNIYAFMSEHKIPFSATIEIGDDCNLDCIHCYRGDKESSYWNADTFERCLVALRKLGTLHITITGGEPLVHPNIFEFINIAKKYGFVISLQSNLTHNVQLLEKALSDASLKDIAVSLYSTDEVIHDSITKVSGSCKKTKANIIYLVTHNFPVTVNCPIMTINKNTIKETKAFCDSLGIDCNFAFKIIPSLSNKRETLKLNCFTSELLHECMKDPAIKLYDNVLENIHKSGPDKRYCQTGFRSITFDAQGNLLICNAYRKKCGNIENLSVKSLWDSSAVLNEWRDTLSLVNPTCASCAAYAYCEPCPAHQYMLTGEDNRIDDLTCKFGKAFFNADHSL